MGRLNTTDAFDPSGLAAELQNYYNGNKDEIHTNMFYNDMWQERFRVIDDVKDRIPLINHDIALEVQPQVDYTSYDKQDNVFKAESRWLQTEEMKVDLTIVPREMARTYYAKYYNSGTDNYDLSFAEFFFEYLNAKIVEQMHLKAFYLGVRNNAGTTTVDTMNGVNKLIADEVAALNLTETATGVITAANVIDSIETLCDAATGVAAWATKQKEVVVNNQIFNWYWKKRRELYKDIVSSYGGSISNINELPIEGYNCTLVREFGLGTSQRVHVTPKENKVLGFDALSDWNNIILQPFERTIKVMIDFKCGFNFAYMFNGSVIVNDQA